MINTTESSAIEIESQNRQKEHSWILAFSVLFSILSAHFISNEPLGLNFFIINNLCFSAMLYLRNKFQQKITRTEYLLISSVSITSLFFIIRQSEVLYWLNILALFMITCLSFSQRYTGSISNIPMIAWILTPFRLIRLCFISATKSIFIGFMPALRLTDKQKHIRSMILGIVWTLPFLMLLGSLLISSDSRFERFAMNIFTFEFSELLNDFLSIAFYFIFISTFFYAVILSSPLKRSSIKKSSLSLDGVQLLTILTLINLLFISYIMIQFSYFFGGEQIISEPGSRTYSSYARRGFWELIFLAMIVLPLLLIAHWLQRDEKKSLQLWFKRSATLMIICLVIIESSAIHRMYLYVHIYDLTELRFYSSIFMIYMIGGLVTFYHTVLKNKRGRFIVVIVIQTLTLIILLNIINPDAQISHYNITHNKKRSIDINYLMRLSTDTYPMIYSQRNSLNELTACSIRYQLKSKLKILKKQTQQWNWSVHQAQEIIKRWDEQCQNKRLKQ